MIEGEIELRKEVFEHGMKHIDVLFGCPMSKFSTQCDGNPILVLSANVKNVTPLQSLISCIAIAGQIRPCNMAKMQRTVSIGKR
jgi:hypothetical protein